MLATTISQLWRSTACSRPWARVLSKGSTRQYSVLPANAVNIVEVGPRDGLQNEKGGIIPVAVKVELIDRLVNAGLVNVEAGSFVSPKWVPQMAGTADVLRGIRRVPGIRYPVLVPNLKGLEDLLRLLEETQIPGTPPATDEIAVFTAATDAFTRANLNCSIAESLVRLEAVAKKALDRGMRVRGYVSVVVECPYSGKTEYRKVKEVARALVDMGCYEVSLGETVGRGRPHEVRGMLEEVKTAVRVDKLAGHFHDTFGMAVANMFAALDAGVRTFDASVGGLGGCPYSPGATGNVATEDVVYALQGSGYDVVGSADGGVNLDRVAEIGWWISEKLGQDTASRAGRAIKARKERESSKL